jgi:membrane protease YdiL (CAAX protease family)
MIKSILLYLFVFFLACLSVWQSDVLGWLMPIALLGVLPTGALWLWRSEGRNFRDLGFKHWRERKMDFLWGTLTGLVVPQLVTTLLLVLGFITTTGAKWQVSLFVGVLGGIALGLVKTFITVFIEELVFRGYYIQSLGKNIKWSLLISSLLFGMLHIPGMVNSGLNTTPVLTGVTSFSLLGIALGLSFISTGKSLFLPLGLHFGYNLGYSSLVFVLSAVKGQPLMFKYLGKPWLIGQSPWTPETGVLGILVILLLTGCVMFITTLLVRSKWA